MSAHENSLKDLQQQANWHFMQYNLYGAYEMKWKFYASLEKYKKVPKT